MAQSTDASAVTGKVLDSLQHTRMLNGVKQRHGWFVGVFFLSHRYDLFSNSRPNLLIGCVVLNMITPGKISLGAAAGDGLAGDGVVRLLALQCLA